MAGHDTNDWKFTIKKHMIIKVCGMSNPADIRAVEAAGADWIGLIFYSKSKRFYDGRMPIASTSRLKRVGVFVNEDIDTLIRLCQKHDLDIVQLHGEESPDYCQAVKNKGWKVIKSFGIDGAKPFPSKLISHYEECVDYFLFDTHTAEYGGSGKRFDWSVLVHYIGKVPFLLSGGIDLPDTTMLRTFHHPQCVGVDINSRFETAPALKDTEKIKQFIQNIRQ